MRFLIPFLFILCPLTAMAEQNAVPINSFETPEDQQMVSARGTVISYITTGPTDGRTAMNVQFLPGDWPNVGFKPKTPWNWKAYSGLAMDLRNPEKVPITFSIRIDDAVGSDGITHCRGGSVTIGAGKSATYVFQFGGGDPMSYGMRALPVISSGTTSINTAGDISFDASHIYEFQLYMHLPLKPVSLVIDNIRLVSVSGTKGIEGIVDEYGQYTGADWPGKLHKLSDFIDRLKKEEADFIAHPSLPDRDMYGGWAAGPTLKATGFFSTEKRNGKWWLVDPNGKLFFSMGIDCVGAGDETIIKGREKMFTWLPTDEDPLAKFKGYASGLHSGPVKEGATFDFHKANLYRKFGESWDNKFLDTAHKRLPSWGFNTIANWSDQRFYIAHRTPYVVSGGVGGSHARVASGSDYWGLMHDPFDPQFAADAKSSLQPLIDKVKNDPYCLGYFVDNELSWGGWGEDGGKYGLAHGALTAAVGSPAKQAFVAQLKKKYSDIEDLNKAWGTSLGSWEKLDQPWEPTGKMNAAMKTDFSAFVKAFALKYFTVIRDVLKQGDPNHLYLGCRFAWRTQDAVEAAAQVCDVVSFNIYNPSVDPKEWSFCKDLGKPCIIGEFHFGALDRGMFHTGLVSTTSQNERAQYYLNYVRSVADNPAFVGCHWFQYIDEPNTGRSYDGENYNIGFTDITDTPYPEMVAAARKVHAEVYKRRDSGNAGTTLK